jgi:hypothetical protein
LSIQKHISRRWKLRLHAATATVSLGIWLLLTVAEAYPALHAWLHGGAIPDNDDCAIVAIAHGKVEAASCDAPAPLPTPGLELTLRVDTLTFSPTRIFLPDCRGPPVLLVVS